MIDRRRFGLLSLSTAALASIAFPLRAATASRRAEALALIRFAEQTHPRGFEARSDAGWRRLSQALVSAADKASYAGFVAAAYRLLAWFKDGHSTIYAAALSEGPFGLTLPVRASVFYDGLFVTDTDAQSQLLLGKRVRRIGTLETNALIQRFAQLWPADNLAWTHHDLGLLLQSPGLLHGLGAVSGEDATPVPIGSEDGTTHTLRPVRSRPEERVRLTRVPSPRESWALEAKTGNFIRRLPQHSALYVCLDTLDVEIPVFTSFTREIFQVMAEPTWSRLIIDLRRNSGGNNFLSEPLRRFIARSRFNRPGGLYILIGPATFSAGQNLVNRLERETFATFVGEPTGGAPRHFGDARPFTIGANTIKAGVSSLPWFDSYPQDTRPWVMPDVLIPRTFADFTAGRDAVLDAALSNTRDGPPDEITTDRILYFRRASQSQRWQPFWM